MEQGVHLEQRLYVDEGIHLEQGLYVEQDFALVGSNRHDPFEHQTRVDRVMGSERIALAHSQAS